MQWYPHAVFPSLVMQVTPFSVVAVESVAMSAASPETSDARRTKRRMRMDVVSLRRPAEDPRVERYFVVAVALPRENRGPLLERPAVDDHPKGSTGRKMRRQFPGPRRAARGHVGRRRLQRLLTEPVGADVRQRVDPDVAERLRVGDARGDARGIDT